MKKIKSNAQKLKGGLRKMEKTILALLITLVFVGSVFAYAISAESQSTVADSSKEGKTETTETVFVTGDSNNAATDTDAVYEDRTSTNSYVVKEENGVTYIGAKEKRALVLKGDMNDDGEVNNFDIDYYTMVYKYPAFFKEKLPEYFARADMDSNGVLNQDDIDLFVQLISSNK